MRRTLLIGSALFLLSAVGSPHAVDAQTKDETIVYALQSDIDSWDPPNSVLREAIIHGATPCPGRELAKLLEA